ETPWKLHRSSMPCFWHSIRVVDMLTSPSRRGEQNMRAHTPRTNPAAPVAQTESPFSPYRAFVVQYRAETSVAQGHIAGRIEHIVSGQATHFDSLQELLAFVER